MSSERSEVIKIFEPKGPPLESEGVVDLVKGFPLTRFGHLAKSGCSISYNVAVRWINMLN